jgi:hypothetical protein
MNIMDIANETLDLHGVAALCKAEPETIAQYARAGEIPGTKMGKSWVFLKDDVIAFLRKRIAEETELRRERHSIGTKPFQPDAVLFNPKARKRRTVLPELPISSQE